MLFEIYTSVDDTALLSIQSINGIALLRSVVLILVILKMLPFFRHHSLLEEFLVESANLQKAAVSFAMSVPPSVWNNSAPTGRVYMKFDISIFFKNLLRILKFHSNLTGTTDTLHEDLHTIVTVCR